MIDTAGTICNAANAIKDLGARAGEGGRHASRSYPVRPSKDRIKAPAIEELVRLNTVPLPERKRSYRRNDIPVRRTAVRGGNDQSLYQRLDQCAV